MHIDDGDELVELPSSVVQGLKTKPDGSILFRMMGGPYHGMTVRTSAPFDRIVFKPNGIVHVYRLRPPHNSKDKWVYAFDALDEEDFTEAERGYDRDPLKIQAKWNAHAAFLARKRAVDEAEADARLRQDPKFREKFLTETNEGDSNAD